MATQIQLRRDPKAYWEAVNPILAEGEMGIEMDTKRAKLGDGVTSWVDLPYYSDSSNLSGSSCRSSMLLGGM